MVSQLEKSYGKGSHGWQNREVKFSYEARWYRSKHFQPSDVGKAAAKAAAKLNTQGKGLSNTSTPGCFAIGGGGAERRLAKKRTPKKGFENKLHCTCEKVGKSKKVQCRSQGQAPKAPSATQRALNKLSRAEEVARGTSKGA